MRVGDDQGKRVVGCTDVESGSRVHREPWKANVGSLHLCQRAHSRNYKQSAAFTDLIEHLNLFNTLTTIYHTPSLRHTLA
jgi:hypothetical protein